MEVVEIELDRLREASWNANGMDAAMLDRLKESISRYGFLENLVVRPICPDAFEVLSGQSAPEGTEGVRLFGSALRCHKSR